MGEGAELLNLLGGLRMGLIEAGNSVAAGGRALLAEAVAGVLEGESEEARAAAEGVLALLG
jgi:hypothetical protein